MANHNHLVYCSDLTLSVIVFSFKPCHHDTTDADKVTIHVFATVVPFSFRPTPDPCKAPYGLAIVGRL